MRHGQLSLKIYSWDKHRKAKFQQPLEMTQLHIHTVEYVALRLLYNEGTLLNVQDILVNFVGLKRYTIHIERFQP